MKTLTRSTSSIPSDRRAPCHSHDNDDDIKMFTSTCILYILYTALSRESVCSREKVTVTLRQKYQQEEGIGNRLFLLIYLAERMGGCVAQSPQSENCIQCRFAERRVESTAPKRLYYY